MRKIDMTIYRSVKALLAGNNSHAFIAKELGIGQRTVARISVSSSYKNYKDKIRREVAERKVRHDKLFVHSNEAGAYIPTPRSNFFNRISRRLRHSKTF